MKRRDFIKGTAGATLTSAAYGNILGSNDKKGLAVAGAGRRGR